MKRLAGWVLIIWQHEFFGISKILMIADKIAMVLKRL